MFWNIFVDIFKAFESEFAMSSASSTSVNNTRIPVMEEGSDSECDFGFAASDDGIDSSNVLTMPTQVPPPAKKQRTKAVKVPDGDADKPGDMARMAMYSNPIEMFAYDMENKVALTAHALNKEKQVRMLFSLCCGLVGVAVDAMPTMHSWDIYKEAEKQFHLVLENWPKTQEARDTFFVFLPGETWPKKFLDYVATKRCPSKHYMSFTKAHKSDITALMASNTISHGEKKQKLDKVHFGYVVWDDFCQSATYCTSKINKLLPESLASGETSVSMLMKVRAALIPDECKTRALQSLLHQNKFLKSKQEDSKVIDLNTPPADAKDCKLDAADDKHPLYAEKYAEQLQRFNLAWFPNCWLCFILLGKFSSRPSAKFVLEATSAAFDKKQEKEEKKAFKKKTNDSSSSSSSSSSNNNNTMSPVLNLDAE